MEDRLEGWQDKGRTGQLSSWPWGGDRTEHKAELGWTGQSGADRAFPHPAFCSPDVLRFFFSGGRIESMCLNLAHSVSLNKS